jgi:hypothetical protein
MKRGALPKFIQIFRLTLKGMEANQLNFSRAILFATDFAATNQRRKKCSQDPLH